MLDKLIIILGPTGSGKSDLAIRLAKEFDGEIISADSRQIYRDFVIGSGLVQGNFKENIYYAQDIPHYLVQFQDPETVFSVAEYKELAIQKIKEITEKKYVPLLVGGTGLYIDAVAKNLIIPKIKPNLALRKKLEAKSNSELLLQLQAIDPESAKTIDKNNKRRLIRALEVSLLGVVTFSQTKQQGPQLFDQLKIGIKIDRSKLYKNIDQRVNQIIEDGLVNEVENLLKLYPRSAPAFSGIGYKETIEYLEGKINESELVQKIKFATHAYARRQITWFKRDPKIHWVKNYSEAEKLTKEFLK